MIAVNFQPAQRKTVFHRTGVIRLVSLIVASLCLNARAADQPVSLIGATFSQPVGGSDDSLAPIMSPDGRYVLFASLARNLAASSGGVPLPYQPTPKMNVYLRDRVAGTTTLVSLNLAGTDGGDGDSFPSAISTNGQFALFESSASSLTPNTSSGTVEIFRRDLVKRQTVMVSATGSGVAANGVSRGSVMTPDGRYVAFVSQATNLVAGDTNGIADVFLCDTQTGSITLVSTGAQNSGGSTSELPAISTDGRYVAFYSTATNLAPGLTNVGEIFIKDTVGGTMIWASGDSHADVYAVHGTSNALSANFVLSDNGQYLAYEACAVTNGAASSLSGGIILRYNLSNDLTGVVNTNALGFLSGAELNTRNLDMTPDGRFVAFVGNVGTAGGSLLTNNIEVWDSLSNTTAVASLNSFGIVPAGQACNWPALDSSGRYVAFFANSPALDTNGSAGPALYVRDLQAAVTHWVDVNGQTNGPSENMMTFPRLSADGAQVAFESLDENLVPNDNNHVYNVFVRNISPATTELISARLPSLPALTGNGASTMLNNSISTNGRYVVFYSDADNLVPGDTNGLRDVFVRDLLSGTSYLVSANAMGGSADGTSWQPAISGNGQFVVFISVADNLIAGATEKGTNVYLRNLQAETTTLVSVTTNGMASGNTFSSSPSVSSDGRYVVFTSPSFSLVTNTTGAAYTGVNVYWRDMTAGKTRALTTSGGYGGSMTPDGQTVAFAQGLQLDLWNAASNVETTITNTGTYTPVIYLSPNGQVICYNTSASVLCAWNVTTKSNKTLGPLTGLSHFSAAFSSDSRFLTYVSTATGTNQIYLYDFQTGSNVLVSQSSTTAPGNGNSDSPTISADGEYVAYRSLAGNLTDNNIIGFPGNGSPSSFPGIFLYDRLLGTNTLLSVERFGNSPANNRSSTPVFSGAGQTLVFASWASDLAAGEGNEWSDIFAFQPYVSGATNSDGSFAINGLSFAPVGWNDSQLAPVFDWFTAPGASYIVQFTDNLEDPDWQTLTNNVSLIGGEGYAIDLTAGATQRFYRIAAQQ